MQRARRRQGSVLAGCVLAAALLAPGPAGAAALVPHVARYALALHPSSRGGDVAALAGRLEVRFAASCDGWELIQSLGFRMLGQDGSALEHLAHLNAFEERDGSRFTFNMRTWEDRELVEALAGTARREADRVRVRYAVPEARIEELPADTVFPAGHVRDVLARARAGTRVMMRTVFDGSTLDNPYQVSTAIGARRARAGDVPAPLEGHASWPVRLAYFDLDAVEPKADFEMSVMLFDNGVAGHMVYDYGDFSIDVALEDVELLPQPSCD